MKIEVKVRELILWLLSYSAFIQRNIESNLSIKEVCKTP